MTKSVSGSSTNTGQQSESSLLGHTMPAGLAALPTWHNILACARHASVPHPTGRALGLEEVGNGRNIAYPSHDYCALPNLCLCNERIRNVIKPHAYTVQERGTRLVSYSHTLLLARRGSGIMQYIE